MAAGLPNPVIASAEAAITKDGLFPRHHIPRHWAETELYSWSQAWRLVHDPQLLERILARFPAGPPGARFGEPFQPLPVDTCIMCATALSFVVPRGGGPGRWQHDITPNDWHPAHPTAAGRASSPAPPVSARR